MVISKLTKLGFIILLSFWFMPLNAFSQNYSSGMLPFPIFSPEAEQMLKTLTIHRPSITDETINIHFHAFPTAEYVGFILALEKGFYHDAGLPNVALQWPNSPDNHNIFSLSSLTPFCVKSLSQSLDSKNIHEAGVVRIAQLFQRSDLAVVSRKDSGIKEIKDLNYKIFQSNAEDALVNLNQFFSRNDLTPKAVYPLGENPTPLIKGLVDACIIDYFDEYHEIIQRAVRPEDLVVFRLYEQGLGIPADGINTLSLYRKNNQLICQAIVEATIKGYYYAFTHEEESLERILAYMQRYNVPSNKKHQAWILKAIYQAYTYRVGPDPRNWGYLSEEDYKNASDYLLGTTDMNRPDINTFFQPPLRDWPEPELPQGRK